MNIKLAIFDFSGTLAEEPTKNIPTILKGLKNSFGLKDGEQGRILDLLKRGMSESYDLYDLSQRVAASLSRELDGELIELLRENIVFKSFEDVKAITSLRIKKVILTNASQWVVDTAKLDKKFEVFYPEYKKPDERSFQSVLDHFEVRPEETVMIGNSLEEDIYPAKKMGITTILIDRGRKLPEQKDTLKIPSLREIEGYLKYLRTLKSC
ncbi:MAG: HAD family hydrolase [Candidatus Paceibacterota bacterium]|jgi:HAD superfamily hydrolase (TIGR01509 family)